MNIFRLAVACQALLLLSGSVIGQSKPPNFAQLPMEMPAELAKATLVGHKSPTDVLHIAVAVPCRDTAGMQAFVDSVSNPKSPNYRQFITPEQVGRRFGIAVSDLKKVSDYLTLQGMSIRLVAKNRLSILADATVAQAEKAFQTSLEDYTVSNTSPSSDNSRYSFTTQPGVPISISRYITTIEGLQNFSLPTPAISLTPSQLQTLYSAASTYNGGFQGAGRTIAITDFTTYGLLNIPLEYAQFNLPTPPGVGKNVKVVSIDGSNGNVNSDAAGEGDADIQCTLNMAPLCNLIIYDDSNRGDYLATITQEAEDNLADIVTESYGHSGETTAYWASIHNEFLSMAAQGITYMCASGDTGTAWIIDFPYPDIDPEVMSVGGTTVAINTAGNRTSEVVWDNPGQSSSGKDMGSGGWAVTSDAFNVLPAYQKGFGVPTNIPYRLIPDVALDADPASGYKVFMNGVSPPKTIGGTSCSSPTMAGMLADCEEQIIAGGGMPANGAGYQRLGRLQDLIYSYNGDPTVFYDIVSGSNGTLPNGETSTAGPGWDTASGWGTIICSGFINKVLGVPQLVNLTLKPATVVGGASSTGTLTLSAAAPTGGTVVTLTSNTTGVTVPATVTVAGGSTAVTFTVSTTPVAAVASATISASAGGLTLTAVLAVDPPILSGVSVSPSFVLGGTGSTGTVTLSGAAPTGGIVVNLSTNSANATVPLSATVAAGSSTATFSVTTTQVSSTVTATITATAGTASVTTTLSVTPPQLNGLTVSPSSVVSGASSIGTVTLNGPASTGGIQVALSSSSSSATLPATVTVLSGATSATFTISTVASSTSVSATITGTQGRVTKTAVLTINPANITGITVAPASVIGGSSSSGTVTIGGVAPSGGTSISLASSSASATVPATVTVAAGTTSATFTVKTSAVSSNATATITGTLGSNQKSAALNITAAVLSALSVSPASVIGGIAATGTVTLTGPAPSSGISVSVTSSAAAATTPATVAVPGGATSKTFTIQTIGVSASVNATITASQGSTSKTASIAITSASISGVTVSPSFVVGGKPTTGTVTLTGAAPTGGASVSLSSSNSAASVPVLVTIPAGQTSATFTVATSTVTVPKVATITGTYKSASSAATLSVNPPTLMSVSLNPASVLGGISSVGTVSLTGPAPAGGFVVKLKSSTTKAIVPASTAIKAGATSATFAVKTAGVAAQTVATITATLGSTSETTALSINPPTLASIALSPANLIGSASSTGTVTLSSAAPAGGIVVRLSSNKSAATVPESLTIPAGSTHTTFKVKTVAVASQGVVTLTATLGSSSVSATLTVNAPALKSLTLSSATVVGGKTSTGTVTISSAAPTGGLGISLSSSLSTASVPATVIIPTGKTSATFSVRTTAVKSKATATITATFGGASKTAILAIS